MSREKGKRYEREIASKLKDYGYDCRRTSQYCGNTGDASDVIGLPGIHIECKHCEQFRIYDWMAQAVHDSAKSGNKPTVFFRKNNAETLVCMRLDDWIDLYREWDAGNLPFNERGEGYYGDL
jgi:Holliday junction resolvase